MCCLIYKFLLILTQKMQISFLKILPENALKFVSKKMRICVKNFAQLQLLASLNTQKKISKPSVIRSVSKTGCSVLKLLINLLHFYIKKGSSGVMVG